MANGTWVRISVMPGGGKGIRYSACHHNNRIFSSSPCFQNCSFFPKWGVEHSISRGYRQHHFLFIGRRTNAGTSCSLNFTALS